MLTHVSTNVCNDKLDSAVGGFQVRIITSFFTDFRLGVVGPVRIAAMGKQLTQKM